MSLPGVLVLGVWGGHEPGGSGLADGGVVDLRGWGSSAVAEARDELLLVFPTIRHLQELTMIDSVDNALAAASERRIQPVEPRVVLDHGGVARVLMPGEPGYDEAAQDPAP